MSILVAILVFGFVIFFHELGHFAMAKRHGIRVHEFAIGMGPKLLSFKKNDTTYSIRLIPMGGYVSMEGEDGNSDDLASFSKKTIWQRASVIFAGPFMNLLLTLLILFSIYLYIGYPSTTIGKLSTNSPAKEVGMLTGDTILEIDGKNIKNWDEVSKTVQLSNGDVVLVKVKRDNEIKTFNVKPLDIKGDYVLGIAAKPETNLGAAFTESFKKTGALTVEMVNFLKDLVTGNLTKEETKQISGPVGIVHVVAKTSEAAETSRDGIAVILLLTALISLNLCIMNLLPIPALDGGRLLLLFIELIRGGKKLNPKIENGIMIASVVLLMGLILFVTYQDIVKLIVK